MSTWAAVSEGLLTSFVLVQAAGYFWPKRAGYHYLKCELSRRGLRNTRIPGECIRDFVNDAYDYACLVCASSSRPGGPGGKVPHFEFQRMLRIHSWGIHAVLTPSTGARHDTDELLIQELLRSEMLRAAIEASGDAADRQRVENEVRSGKSWDRHRAILSRYDLPAPLAADAVGTPN
jgi:hypothetical protein